VRLGVAASLQGCQQTRLPASLPHPRAHPSPLCLPHPPTPSPALQVKETKKIWGENDVKITGTCIRVPVMRAHAESINLEFEKDISGGCRGAVVDCVGVRWEGTAVRDEGEGCWCRRVLSGM
jgi:hypothetical protein